MKNRNVTLPLLFGILLLLVASCAGSKSVSNATSKDASSQSGNVSNDDRDGMSFEKAIVVNSIKEEYQWIQSMYPGSSVQQQALVKNNGKPYDVLTFVTKDRETKKAYFDISKFFGKAF
jgi:hypothetical protein